MIYSNRALKRLLVPLVIEQVLVMLVGMVDTVMVASAGEAAVSGVALVDMVNYLIITVMAALTTGGSVIISQYAGSCQPEQAERSAGQLMTATLLLSAAILAVCLLGRDAILRLFFGSVEADVMAAAQTYFMITACSFPFLGIYDAGAALLIVLHNALALLLHPTSFNLANSLRAAGDARFTMIVGICSMIVFRLGSALLFGKLLGLRIVGVWIAMGMDWLARSIAFSIRYKNGKWKEKRAI